MIPDIRKVQGALEDKYQNSRIAKEKELTAKVESGDMEGYRAAVNSEGKEIAKEATDAYRQLAQYLLVKFMDGNMKKTDDKGDFIKSEYDLPVYPSFPGYDKKYYENIVKETGDHFLISE